VGTLKSALRLLALWHWSRGFKTPPNVTQSHNVIATHTHTRSFIPPNQYRDVYFGPLVDQAASSDSTTRTIILGLVLEHPREQFKKLKALRFRLPVIPLESCLSLRDLAACFLQALKLYLHPVRLNGPAIIEGVDVSHLISEEIRNSRDSGEFMMNLHVYYCAKWLANTVRVTRCLYPFENRSWEKMLMLGMRDVSPEIRIAGYQHTSITLGHTNLMLGASEAPTTPLPDSILTTGQVTKDWLEQNGNFPPDLFHTACALRQSQEQRPPQTKRPKTIMNVLVVLATSLDEYVNILLFLERAFMCHSGYDLRIRPHPSLIPLDPALAITPIKSREFFTESTGSFQDALEWADLVLYSSSTVCLEAVSLGIPTMYIDLGFHVPTDPMFSCDEFKWNVEDPSELIETIHRIEDLPDDTYAELQEKGKCYAESYLRPVTEEGLSIFWEN
jgi:surface carbohydrate biosynthesis protein (TIGR04326 family)